MSSRKRRAPARTGRRPPAPRAAPPPADRPTAAPPPRPATAAGAPAAAPAARFMPAATLAVTFAGALILFALTLAPTITFEDAGELIAAASSLGVPHEPGYPLWTLVAHAFTWLPIGNVALRCNLMSAVFTALAAALVAWATMLIVDDCRGGGAGGRPGSARRSGSAAPGRAQADLAAASPWWPATGAGSLLPCAAGLAAGLLAATAATTWSQAIITEVYGLNAALVGLLLVLTLVWGRAPTARLRGRLFLAICLVMGLGLTAHDTFIVFLPVVALYGLVLERRLRPSWGRLAAGAGLYFLGLAPYLYLPLAAARSPLMNWGDPRSWTTFWRVVTRRQYVTGGHSGPRATLAELGTSVSLLVHQWLPSLLVLAAVGLAVLFTRRRPLFWLPSTLLVATWPVVTLSPTSPANTATALANADEKALARSSTSPRTSCSPCSWGSVPGGCAARALTWRAAQRSAGAPALARSASWRPFSWPCRSASARPARRALTMHRYRFADAYIHNVLLLASPHSLIMVDRDQFGFPLDYAQDVDGLRPDVVVLDQELLRRSWYLHDLAAPLPALIAGSRTQVEAFLAAVKPFEQGRPYDGSRHRHRLLRDDRLARASVRRWPGASVYFTYGPDARIVSGFYGEPLAVVLGARTTGPGKSEAGAAAWLTPVDLGRYDFAHLTDGTVPLDRNVLMIRTWYGDPAGRSRAAARPGRRVRAQAAPFRGARSRKRVLARRAGPPIEPVAEAQTGAPASLPPELGVDAARTALRPGALGHRGHLDAVGEDDALSPAAGDAEVGVARLFGAVHAAAHDRYADRRAVRAQTPLDRLGEADDVDLGAAAGRARDEVGAAAAQLEGLEDGPGDAHLFDRVGGQRDADRVADALGQQRADADRALDGARPGGAGLGHSHVQRRVGTQRERPVGGDRVGHARALHGELVVGEAPLVEAPRVAQRGLDQGGGRVGLGQATQVARQRAGVHPYANGRAVPPGGLDDGPHVSVVTDGAGVDAHGRGACVEGGAGEAPVEVDVGHDRHRRVAHDLGEGVDVGGGRQRDAHELAAGRRQRADLLEGRRGVGGGGVGHRLHDDLGAAADRHGADVDLSHAAHEVRILPGAAGGVSAVRAGLAPGRRSPPGRSQPAGRRAPAGRPAQR